MHIDKQGGYLGKEAGRRKERRREETRKGGESGETSGSLRTSLQPLETRPHRPRGPAQPRRAGSLPSHSRLCPAREQPQTTVQLVMKLSDVDLH